MVTVYPDNPAKHDLATTLGTLMLCDPRTGAVTVVFLIILLVVGLLLIVLLQAVVTVIVFFVLRVVTRSRKPMPGEQPCGDESDDPVQQFFEHQITQTRSKLQADEADTVGATTLTTGEVGTGRSIEQVRGALKE